MASPRQVTFFGIYQSVLLVVLGILFIISCTVPKKYQAGKPFVFNTTIDLNSNQKGSEKVALKTRLENYLDDSLKVRKVLGIRWIPPFFHYKLVTPPVFDTLAIDRSKTFLFGLLNAEGYFNPTITDTFRIDTVKDQMRVKVNFFVTAGVQYVLDSIGYVLETPHLQQLALQNAAASVLKKNEPFSIDKISAERDRLINLFRNHGYYKVSREDVYVERDTVIAALIDPTLDPLEQFRILDSLQKNRKNPTINLTIRQRMGRDTANLQQYYVGDITVYPDVPPLQDSADVESKVTVIDDYRIVYSSNRFKLPFIARNISLKKGQLYSQQEHYKTINKFSNFSAWDQVDIDLFERMDSVPLLDATIRLYPRKKRTLNIDFETSRNTTDLLTTGSLFGIGVIVGVTNRNGYRESIITNSNIRVGIEFGADAVQTGQAIFSHNIMIPRYIKPFQRLNRKNFDLPRTLINFHTAYTNRKEFVNIKSIHTSFGVEGTRKNHTWQWLPFNVEYADVTGIKSVDENGNVKDSVDELVKQYPWLKQTYEDQFIISQILTYSYRKANQNKLNFFSSRLESSGALTGMIEELDRGELRRFLRLDAEFKHFINYTKSTLAFRAFAGYAYIYGRSGDTMENNLPSFKAFFAGGPYSMRAWQIRRLGLGSSDLYNTGGDTGKVDRFGDVKTEFNVEYRFDIATIGALKLKSAFFLDIGNIWAKTYKDGVLIPEAQFSFNRFYRDLAVGGGSSLRFDFDYFLIRLDWAYKLKDPTIDEQKGWFNNLTIGNGQFQLGIGYPF